MEGTGIGMWGGREGAVSRRLWTEEDETETETEEGGREEGRWISMAPPRPAEARRDPTATRPQPADRRRRNGPTGRALARRRRAAVGRCRGPGLAPAEEEAPGRGPSPPLAPRPTRPPPRARAPTPQPPADLPARLRRPIRLQEGKSRGKFVK